MSGEVDARLAAHEITLPNPAPPAANYQPFALSGNLVYVSGQLPFVDGNVKFAGRVGESLTVEDGAVAARLCALHIVALVREACDGDLDQVIRCVRIGGFVNSVADFLAHPSVINGASDLMMEVFGKKGAHARYAVGVNSLPFNAAVEVEAIFEIEPAPA